MKFSFFSICLALSGLVFLSSCSKEGFEPSDDELIGLIVSATNKQVITVAELPSVSKSELDENYSESAVESSLLAPEFGYQVQTRREKGTEIGKAGEVYFALDGRKLLKGKDKDCNKMDRECYYGDDKEHDRKECFDLVFPVNFTMPDASTVTGVDELELWENIKTWYEANPDSRKEKPVLQYPVDVEFDDGSTATITSEEDLKAAYLRCPDRDGEDVDRKDCFKLEFPLTYAMPDGSTVTGADKRELWENISAWYTAHPDAKEDEPVLQYPVNITYLDGTSATLTSDEDLRAAYASCPD